MTTRDPIPLLPPMQRRRRRRRSYWPFIALVVVVTAGALGVIAAVAERRYKQVADESFQAAEDLFSTGAFSKAERAYDAFRQQHRSDPRAEQAAVTGELAKLAQSVSDDLADPARVTERLDKYWFSHRDTQHVAARWPVILTLAERTARSAAERAGRTLAADELQSARTWLDWLHKQQQARSPGSDDLVLGDLDKLTAEADSRIAAADRQRGFIDAAERAIADSTPENFAAAFRAHERWRSGERATDSAVAAVHERLRQALRAQVRFGPPPAQADETPEPMPRLPVEAYTLLSTRQQHRTVRLTSADPVFVRAKDLCFALEPASGSVRWVLRVGYDAPVPQLVALPGRPAALVPWFREADEADSMLSLCDVTTGEAIWTWRSPDVLAGLPAVTRDSVFAAASSGAVWQLDLASGTPRAALVLPEPIAAPPVVREDGRGICLVGAQQAVYLFEVGRDSTDCVDVVLIGRRSDTADCHALWVPPYVVVFENDLVSRCYVRVLYRDSGGHRTVRELELEGRMWQPPVLDGADIFLVTDRCKRYSFGLHPADSSVNLYQAAPSSSPGPLTQPVQPYFARADDVPFLAVTDSLAAYRLDRARGMLMESWHRTAQRPETRCVQPLQAVENVAATVWQEPDSDGVLVQAVSAQRGEPVWEARLAAAARDLAVTDASGFQIVAQGPGMFLLSRRGDGGWQSRVLDVPAASLPLETTPDGVELVYSSDGGTRLQAVSTRDWQPVHTLQQTPSVTSELATCKLSSVVAGETRDPQDYTVFVTAGRTIEMRGWRRGGEQIHGVRIPAGRPGEDLRRWQPVVLREPDNDHEFALRGIVVSHPSGVVCRAEVRRTEGILHLLVTECRSDLPQLVSPAIAFAGGLLCAGADGRCLLLDPTTLGTVAQWQAPGAIRGMVTAGELLFLGLERSWDGFAVESFRYDGERFAPVWRRELPGNDWRLTGARRDDPRSIVAWSARGELMAWDPSSGQTVWSYDAPAPLALPPRWAGDELVLATIDGGVFFVPGVSSRQ